MTKFIELTPGNLAEEHLCCALSGGKHEAGVAAKKAWLRERLAEGLQFIKLDARAKVFVEFMPAEYAWRPVVAPGYIFIHCLWVSGRYQGQGYARQLLRQCETAAEGKAGLAVIASKDTWLTDPAFYARHGYTVCDEAPPNFQLMVKKNDTAAPDPQFTTVAKTGLQPDFQALTITYSDQCPFFGAYAAEMAAAAREAGLPVQVIHLTDAAMARVSDSPYGAFGYFYRGRFLGHQVRTGKQFVDWLRKEGVLGR